MKVKRKTKSKSKIVVAVLPENDPLRRAMMDAIQQIMPADMKLTVEGDQVTFHPLTPKGRRWIEARGVDPNVSSYSASWKRPKRIIGSDYQKALRDMAGLKMVLDDTRLPARLWPERLTED